MQRRYYLQAGIASTLGITAGCMSGSERESYDSSDIDQMYPGLEAFPDGWQRNDDLNDNYGAAFQNEDESIYVLMSVYVLETVEDAKDRYTRWEEQIDGNQISLANEAFWTERNGLANVGVRHLNALGECAAARQSDSGWGPDKNRAIDYAEAMYDHWQTV